MALSFASLPQDTQKQVLAGLVEEQVECAPLDDILAAHGFCSPCRDWSGSTQCMDFDVFAVDTEGYDYKIVQQLLPVDEAGCRTRRSRPAVIFIEIGLLSPAHQAAVATLLQAQVATSRLCFCASCPPLLPLACSTYNMHMHTSAAWPHTQTHA